jgi:hypothetical protein
MGVEETLGDLDEQKKVQTNKMEPTWRFCQTKAIFCCRLQFCSSIYNALQVLFQDNGSHVGPAKALYPGELATQAWLIKARNNIVTVNTCRFTQPMHGAGARELALAAAALPFRRVSCKAREP